MLAACSGQPDVPDVPDASVAPDASNIQNDAGTGDVEICDDGIDNDGDSSIDCSDPDCECMPPECGDGNLDEGEECDDGTGGNTAECDSDCTVSLCGDGWVNTAAGEDCDDNGESAACDSDCTVVACGDGLTNTRAGEVCDDSNTVDGDGCNAVCTSDESCGNGVLDAPVGEVCDDGNTSDGDVCDATCTVSTAVLAVGGHHTCAHTNTGTVRCWGWGSYGRLGYGNTNYIGDDETPASAGDVDVGGVAVSIAAGGFHTCARLGTGAIRCWSRGFYGQLGYGNMNDIGENETPASAGDVPDL